MAKAIRIHEHGGPEVLQLEDVGELTPGTGQAVVEVAAAGVNFIDIYQRSGVYPLELPTVLGSEGAGTVTAVGADVTGIAVGDRVAWAQEPGGYATHALLRADRLVRVPEGVELETAAAIMLQGMTAHYLVRSTYPVRRGDAVLVHAAAGGAGALVVQLAAARGARVLATASTEEKRAIALDAGAERAIGYDGFADAAREFTDGVGMHVVYDGVGKDTFDNSMASLRKRGYLVLFGASSGPVPPVDPQRLNRAGSIYLTRPTMHDYVIGDELHWRAGEILDAVRDGSLVVRIGGTYPLAEAGRAHEDLAARRTTGKLLLMP